MIQASLVYTVSCRAARAIQRKLKPTNQTKKIILGAFSLSFKFNNTQTPCLIHAVVHILLWAYIQPLAPSNTGINLMY